MSTPGEFSSARGGGGGGGGGENDAINAAADKEVAVLVIQVESPNVLYVRKTPLSAEERSFLCAMAEYCGHLNTASSSFSSSGWRASLNDRRLKVGDKYLALDSRPGGSEWRRALLTNVVTVRGGHRYVLIEYVRWGQETIYIRELTICSKLNPGPQRHRRLRRPSLSLSFSIHPEHAFI